jgi:hypothetical protein
MERHQLVAALCVLIAVFYGLLVWMPANKKLGTLLYQEQKQTARLRAGGEVKGTLETLNVGGQDINKTREELAKTLGALAALKDEQARFGRRFLPLDDLESLQALKSELARLAETGDMEVTALEHIYRRPEDSERPPTLELLREASEGNRYRRPLLRLKARASYRGLMQFLDGLAKLSHTAAPVWSDITVKSDRRPPAQDNNIIGGGGDTGPSKQWLEVEIRLAI